MYTKNLFLSIIAHKFVWISVGQYFSFAEIIHPCQKSSHYVVEPPFASHIATHLLWLWTAECWVTLLQWLCQVAGYWQELEQCCCICRSRSSPTRSMAGMSCESAGHARTPSASRNCVEILATWGLAWPYCNRRWWSWMKGTKTGLLVSVSLCIHNAMPIKHTWACRPCRSKPLTPTMPYMLSPICTVRKFSKCQTPSNVSIHSRWLWWRTAVRWRPRGGQQSCRWASLRRFMSACVAAAVQVAGLSREAGWMYYQVPISLKRLWDNLINQQLIDWLIGWLIKLHLLEWHFCCGQPEVHLCNNYASP